jgi:hypothetical protein
MEALMLAHQPRKAAVRMLVLVELYEVPEVPVGVRHSLVGVVEVCCLEWHVVPFHARDFTRLAANARGSVNEFANLILALGPRAGNRSGVGRDLLDT